MMKIIDWFSDEKNKEKVGAITGFLEKNLACVTHSIRFIWNIIW